MPKRLAIILGAGASYDLIPPDQRGRLVTNSAFAPPLTENLFSMHHEVESIVQRYPLAHNAITYLRGRVGRDNNTLESVLRDLAASPEVLVQQEFRQIPLLLQHLFLMISTRYCRQPTNYSHLVRQTQRSDVEAVAYVTLNYDLFLERALQILSGVAFGELGDYIPADKKWIYTKLHGSANWGRLLNENVVLRGSGLELLLEEVSKLDPAKDLGDEIIVHNPLDTTPSHQRPVYPSITVPVEGKHRFNCPPEHVEKLGQFLETCHDYLFIGVSGRDRDLLEFVAEHATPARLVGLVVADDEKDETQARLRESVPQFRKAGWRLEEGGFSEFMASDGISRFLS